MKQAELDKITEDVIALLKKSGIVSISKSGSTQAETGSSKGPAEAAVPRSPQEGSYARSCGNHG